MQTGTGGCISSYKGDQIVKQNSQFIKWTSYKALTSCQLFVSFENGFSGS